MGTADSLDLLFGGGLPAPRGAQIHQCQRVRQRLPDVILGAGDCTIEFGFGGHDAAVGLRVGRAQHDFPVVEQRRCACQEFSPSQPQPVRIPSDRDPREIRPGEFVREAQLQEIDPLAAQPQIVEVCRDVGPDPGPVSFDPLNRPFDLGGRPPLEVESPREAEKRRERDQMMLHRIVDHIHDRHVALPGERPRAAADHLRVQ